MAISPGSFSRKSSSLSPSKLKQKEALGPKKKVIKKKHSDSKQKSKKKVTFDVPKDAIPSDMPNAKSTKGSQESQAMSYEMIRAQEVQAKLPSSFPSFIKLMLHSHVVHGFWLSFPKDFCDLHLPKHDCTIWLLDENDKATDTKYLIDKNGLSGGWRGFAMAHKLRPGDVLVYQLIEPVKFKVYIVRQNCLTEIDGAVCLLNLDARDRVEPLKIRPPEEPLHPICLKDQPEDSLNTISLKGQPEDSLSPNSLEGVQEEITVSLDDSGNDTDTEILEGLRFSQSIVDFSVVKSFKDFYIVVDDVIIDSEIDKSIRIKYYELCRSRQSYLHNNLLKGLNLNLVCGIISETVNIADAIRACKLFTPHTHLETWDKTLKGFEAMGMDVGFLRTRISKLMNLLSESVMALEAKRAVKMKAEEEMRFAEEKLLKMRKAMKVLDNEIETLKLESMTFEPVFHKEATAPW